MNVKWKGQGKEKVVAQVMLKQIRNNEETESDNQRMEENKTFNKMPENQYKTKKIWVISIFD